MRRKNFWRKDRIFWY